MSKKTAKNRLMRRLGEVDEKYVKEAEYTKKELKNLDTDKACATLAAAEQTEAETSKVQPEVPFAGRVDHEIDQEVLPTKNNNIITIVRIAVSMSLVAAAAILFIFLWNPNRSQVATTTEAETTQEQSEAPTETEAGSETNTEAVSTQEATAEVSGVMLNEENIPSEIFREYIRVNYDTDGNGALSDQELGAVKELSVSAIWNDEQIENRLVDLKGLELFTALESLDCQYAHLDELDVSHNPELSVLKCSENYLTALDLSHNLKLTELDCDVNQIEKLDVSHNPDLSVLRCYNNHLTELDVSQNPALVCLECGRNDLVSLDVSHNPALARLDCSDVGLKTLDVSHNPNMEVLSCGFNDLTSLDVSQNPKLEELLCNYCALTNLDVRNNPNLEMFLCNKDLPVSGAESGYEFQWEEAGEKGYETGCYYKRGLNVDLP